MAAVAPDVFYHRSLDGSFARLPYIDYEVRKDVFEEAAKKTGITLGTAYTVRDKKLVPVLYVLKKDQDYKRYATKWEVSHSKLAFGAGSGDADPIVDENMTVVGHLRWFSRDAIFIPQKEFEVTRKVTKMVRGQSRSLMGMLTDRDPLKASEENRRNMAPKPFVVEENRSLGQLLDAGVQIYADVTPNAYLKQGYVTPLPPLTNYRLATDPEGRVLFLVAVHDLEAVQPSWVTPLDLISIGKLVFLLGSAVVGMVAIRVLARTVAVRLMKGAVRELETVGADELAGGAAREAAMDATRGTTGSAAREGASAAVREAPEAAKPLVVKQIKRVTRADMMKWEEEGGHTLQNHGNGLTKENLRSRITGKEQLAAPQLKKGGVKDADFRTWLGKKTDAASKWESEEVMHKTVTDLINKNLDEIRRVTRNGGKFAIEGQRVGYVTGSGWVPSAGGPMFGRLDGVSLYIEPTTKNAEGWFVRTAFPDMSPAIY